MATDHSPKLRTACNSVAARASETAFRGRIISISVFSAAHAHHASRVRAAVKTAVEKLDACGVQPFPQLSRRRAHQRERNFVPAAPLNT